MILVALAMAGPLDDGVAALEALRADPADGAALEQVAKSASTAGVKELLVDAVLVAAAVPDAIAAEAAFATGMRRWRQGDAGEAVRWLAKVPATSDDWGLATLLRARSARSARTYKVAVRLCREILERNGGSGPRAGFVAELARVELAAMVESSDPYRAAVEYDAMPEGSVLAGLTTARVAEIERERGSVKPARKTLETVPSGAAWFPEMTAIEAEVATEKCRGGVPAVVTAGQARIEAELASLPTVAPGDLRVDLKVTSDVERLVHEVEVARAAGSPYAAEVELDLDLWMAVQRGLATAQAERALQRVKDAAARCGKR
ncbi:MAG: hypothetical protein R3F61_14260 [Myxococcota bacterium]